MNHENIQEQISQFMDNELPKEQHRELFMHLAECEECREFFADVKRIHDLSNKLIEETFPLEMDRKFDVLTMAGGTSPAIPHVITFSLPSAILSGMLIVMMSLLLFLSITSKEEPMNTFPANEQAMMMLPYSSPQVNHQ